MVTLGTRLRALREEKGLTLEQVANSVGTTKVSIGRYEKDEREPKSEMLNLLADFFDVSVDYLLGRETFKHLKTQSADSLLTGAGKTITTNNDLSKKEILDIEKEAQQMIDNLEVADVVEFCGTPADEEDKEFLKMAELNQRGIQLAEKELLIDLREYGWRQEKAEGLALVNDRTIALINDNDFGVAIDLQDPENKKAEVTDYIYHEDGTFTLDGKSAKQR